MIAGLVFLATLLLVVGVSFLHAAENWPSLAFACAFIFLSLLVLVMAAREGGA